MPNNIKPEVLRDLRERRGWSLTDLAARSKVDKQTIFRIEKGEHRSTRAHTVQQLAKALDVDSDVLIGVQAPPATAPVNRVAKSQFNIRLSNAARNALLLLTHRYPMVSQSDVIELAPFLFFWAAEASLRWRRERIADFERVAEHTSELHAIAGSAFDSIADAIDLQKHSIDHRDVLGEWPLLSADADEGESPFADFLRQLVSDFDGVAVFESWEERPKYRICPDEAAELVGGDPDSTDEILNGFVSLHEMPEQLRDRVFYGPFVLVLSDEPSADDALAAERKRNRAEWVRLKADEYRRRKDGAADVTLSDMSEADRD